MIINSICYKKMVIRILLERQNSTYIQIDLKSPEIEEKTKDPFVNWLTKKIFKSD